ncbi:MAG: hypothetical protein ACREVN_03580 [Gammaproteobacteria bacterium]
MRTSMRTMVFLLAVIAAGVTTPAMAIMSFQDELRPLPKVVVTINADRLSEAFGVQSVAGKFWAVVGQRYDAMAEFRNVGGQFRADEVYARFCLPQCGPAVRQASAVIARRPRSTFRSAFTRAFNRGELSRQLSSGPPDPGATLIVGDYRYGTSYCIYGDCGLSQIIGAAGSSTCVTGMDGRVFCANL